MPPPRDPIPPDLATVSGLWRTLRAVRGLCCALCVLVVLVLAPHAPAQIMENERAGLRVDSITWGWQDVMPGDRFAPVHIRVSSTDPFAGVAILEYPQDASQNARIVVPFSTTPGVSVPVELVACLPRGCAFVNLTITDGDVTLRGSFRASTPGSGPTQLLLPPILSMPCRVGLIGSWDTADKFGIADFSSAAFFGNNESWYATSAAFKEQWWRDAHVLQIPAAELPTGWLAYEGLDVIVAREEDLRRVDARALDALHSWIHAGGRLVLRVSQAGSDAARLLPSDVPPLVELLDAQPVSVTSSLPGVPSALAHAVGRCFDNQAIEVPTTPPWFEVDMDTDPADAEETTQPPPATTTPAKNTRPVQDATDLLTTTPVPARRFRITPQGVAAGWTTGWHAPEAEGSTLTPNPTTTGLLASGPSGLGQVVLIGIEPESAARMMSKDVATALWRDAIDGVLPHWCRVSFGPTGFNAYWSGSGADNTTTEAITASLDSITTTPAIGSGFFVVLAFATAALALLVGPVGWLLLRRRRRLAGFWKFSLLCIALASVIALIAPMLLRSGETTVGRFACVDAIADPRGALISGASTAVMGAFAGKPGAMAPPGTSQTAWVRGISTKAVREVRGSRIEPLSAVLAPAGLQRAGLAPAEWAFGQWTYRALLEQDRDLPAWARGITIEKLAIRALTKKSASESSSATELSTEPGLDYECALTLQGLPEGCTVEDVSVLVHGRSFKSAVKSSPTLFAASAESPRITLGWATTRENLAHISSEQRSRMDQGNYYSYVRGSNPSNANLPVTRERGATIERYLASHRWVCVHVTLAGLPVDWAKDQQSWALIKTAHRGVLRVLVPVSDADAQRLESLARETRTEVGTQRPWNADVLPNVPAPSVPAPKDPAGGSP
jgi:hypothetical protein